MQNMIFRGQLKDFLESKKIDIERWVRFGIINENALLEEFHIEIPVINFINPVDIERISDKNQNFYILKFNITGDTTVLNYKPSISFEMMPEWLIKNKEIWIQIEESDIETMKIYIDGIIDTFQSHLEDISADINIYNSSLIIDIQKIINSYNNKISKTHENIDEIRNHLLFNY